MRTVVKAALPALAPSLMPGEIVLLQDGRAATTLIDGEGGYLHFRMWEAVVPPPLGLVVLLGYVWQVSSEFVVGSIGREPLRQHLNRRAVAEMHVVRGEGEQLYAEGVDVYLKGLADEEVDDLARAHAATADKELAGALARAEATLPDLSEVSAWVKGVATTEPCWYGVIMAEAATTFADGGGVIQQAELCMLDDAKAWVCKKLAELLKKEEEVSQAVVLGPGGSGFELSPATWPHEGFECQPEWIEIEVEGEN